MKRSGTRDQMAESWVLLRFTRVRREISVKKIIGISALMMSLSAYADSYLPPARIQCGLDEADQLNCHEFDRQFLTENTFDAGLQRNRAKTFLFYSAIADHDSLIYTYKTLRFKTVTLKTANSSIRPDLAAGHWKKIGNELYVCDAGDAGCGMLR